MSETARSHNGTMTEGRPLRAGVASEELPALCRNPDCGHEFLGFRIRVIEGQQVLVDLEGNVVYELAMVCRYCTVVFTWHTSHKMMQRHTAALEKLIRSVGKMWEGGEEQGRSMRPEPPDGPPDVEPPGPGPTGVK